MTCWGFAAMLRLWVRLQPEVDAAGCTSAAGLCGDLADEAIEQVRHVAGQGGQLRRGEAGEQVRGGGDHAELSRQADQQLWTKKPAGASRRAAAILLVLVLLLVLLFLLILLLIFLLRESPAGSFRE